MNLEIHKPEPMQRMNAQIQHRLHDAEERLEQALDALDEKSPVPVTPRGSLHEFLMNSPLRGANLHLERTKDQPRRLTSNERVSLLCGVKRQASFRERSSAVLCGVCANHPAPTTLPSSRWRVYDDWSQKGRCYRAIHS